ncbi:hypothetical protein EG68_09500 [Paragonimus skrjabini miyazakii]|uniref:Reverse transcriptase domain-containing protein n=1 Tax=Paragonimus skrjabini miyazakii TaxID=59628 RepID=A0A8S9YSU1_9TREM|nr:hypothetical protein EG68_09500 [Paragonimus skrjabini miyazakii]
MVGTLVERLRQHLEFNGLRASTQRGFCKIRLRVTSMLAATDRQIKAADDHPATDVLFLDFINAFDRIGYMILIANLPFLPMAHRLPKGQHICVTVNGEFS